MVGTCKLLRHMHCIQDISVRDTEVQLYINIAEKCSDLKQLRSRKETTVTARKKPAHYRRVHVQDLINGCT